MQSWKNRLGGHLLGDLERQLQKTSKCVLVVSAFTQDSWEGRMYYIDVAFSINPSVMGAAG